MNDGLITLNPRITTPAVFNFLDNVSIPDTQSFRREFKTESRQEFIGRLKEIRKRCEVTFHKTLLEYFPDNSHYQLSASPKIERNLGFWYTDTHLGCKRSDAAPLIYSLHKLLGRLSYSVSVGDEHDFGHSLLKDPIASAIEHKIRLAERYPHCKQHTLAGNHDGADEYINGLKEAAKKYPNIVVHRYVAKVGGHLFTHGDCIHWENPTTAQIDNYRAGYNNGWKPNLAERVFDRTTQILRLNTLFPEKVLEYIIPRQVQAERILAFIRSINPSLLNGVHTICFGHTHKAFSTFHYKGYKFTNGGAHETGFSQGLHIFSTKPRSNNNFSVSNN